MFPLVKLVSGSILALAITGCATISNHDDKYQKDSAVVESAGIALNKMRGTGAVAHMDRPKLAGDMLEIKKPLDIPPVFNMPFYYSSAFATNNMVLTEISRRTGYRINVQRTRPSANPQEITSEEAALSRSIEWRGTLSGLLDHISSNMDRFWAYRDGSIHFFKTDTRTYSLYLPTGKKSLSSSIALTGSGDASGNVSVTSENEIDPYVPLLESIKALVADGDTDIAENAVVLNQGLGLLTVTATPPQLDRIGRIIDSINQRFAQNVLVGVKIYNLTLSKDANAGASMDVIYQNISKNINASLVAPILPNPATGLPGQIVVSRPDGDFAGSRGLIQALSEIGKVSFVNSGQVVAANGQPSPIQIANEFTFLASSSTTQGVNTGVTTTLTPETRKVGLTANFLPLILGDNRILLQYQINLSSLLSLNEVSSGDSTIQTPNISSQSLQQQAFLRDGQSIVLFGFEQERTSFQERKGFSSIGRTSGSERNVMIIVLEVSGGK